MKVLAALAALLLAAPSLAQTAAQPSMVPAGTVPTITPDRAYILYRMPAGVGLSTTEPVFMREVEDGGSEPNVFKTNSKQPFVKGAVESVFLVDVQPGTYVFLGPNFHGAVSLATCWCFGTVKFVARAGAITDMGYILIDRIDKVSAIPELAGVTGNREKISPDQLRMAGAIRPYSEGMPVPEPIAHLIRIAADYRAVGKFPNKFAYSINRLAAIPGVLAYDEDRVIDVKAEGDGAVPKR